MQIIARIAIIDQGLISIMEWNACSHSHSQGVKYLNQSIENYLSLLKKTSGGFYVEILMIPLKAEHQLWTAYYISNHMQLQQQWS